MPKNKEIVFVNQNAGYLMIDTINVHVPHYASITLITGKIIQRQTPLHPSVKVQKIVPYDRSSTLKRLFTWFWGTLQILWLIAIKHRGATLFLVSNPPFAPLLPLVLRNPFKLLIYDVYPDALTEYKIFKSTSGFIKLWKWANRKVFGRAVSIFTLSEGMKNVMPRWARKIFVFVTGGG